MNFNEFTDYICNNVLMGWKDDAYVDIQTIKKNNGVAYTGIYIQEEDSCVSPTIYMEDYYERYLSGESVYDIIEEIRKHYEWAMAHIEPFEHNVMEYSAIKDWIIYRLVNYERNEEMMETCPHIRMDDLAVIFRWVAHRDSVGISTALITHDELELWGVGLQEILLDAQRNTEKMFPGKVIKMENFIREMIMDLPESDDSVPMYIITNEQQLNGATVLLYEDFLKNFAKEHPGNYYILPSSIHEVILISENHVNHPENLSEVVQQANNYVVKETEILSESVYYYDSARNSITIVDAA